MNQRQQLFAYKYLETGNATLAYKVAYGVEDDNTAAVSGSKLLRNAKVSAFISERQKATAQQVEASIEDVVRSISRLAATARTDSEKLKALDMLMKHLGGYMHPSEIIEKMGEEYALKLIEQLRERYKAMKA
jgi:phage terminase small subunit